MAEQDPQAPLFPQLAVRLALAEGAVRDVTQALAERGIEAQEVRVDRVAEGSYLFTIKPWGNAYSPMVYSWDAGDVTELEAPVPYSGASGADGEA